MNDDEIIRKAIFHTTGKPLEYPNTTGLSNQEIENTIKEAIRLAREDEIQTAREERATMHEIKDTRMNEAIRAERERILNIINTDSQKGLIPYIEAKKLIGEISKGAAKK